VEPLEIDCEGGVVIADEVVLAELGPVDAQVVAGRGIGEGSLVVRTELEVATDATSRGWRTVAKMK
jgi:hypothetical protein